MSNSCLETTSCDASGNINAFVSETGEVVAEYSYDGFGRTLSATGPMAGFFRHRFSTKYLDDETGFYYYGHRYYAPELTRWTTRDPLGEDGGLNLYSFCGNDGVNNLDSLGMWSVKSGQYSGYDVVIDSGFVADDVFWSISDKFGRERDSKTIGYTETGTAPGKFNTALDAPSYVWKVKSKKGCINIYALVPSNDAHYDILIRIRDKHKNHFYPGKSGDVPIVKHEEQHALHQLKYLEKMTACFEKMASLGEMKESKTSAVKMYIREMHDYYNNLTLYITKEMDNLHYNARIPNGSHKNYAEKSLQNAKGILSKHSDIFGEVCCEEWTTYEQDLPIP